jgi:hypothetical protein
MILQARGDIGNATYLHIKGSIANHVMSLALMINKTFFSRTILTIHTLFRISIFF